MLGNDEIGQKDNLIKCLNIQFGKANKVSINNDKNINEESNKCITISEDNSVKSKIKENRGKISLKKKIAKENLMMKLLRLKVKKK